MRYMNKDEEKEVVWYDQKGNMFPWEDVEACMHNDIKPLVNEKPCPICGKPSEELKWINFISPDWTWREKCGVDGKLSICTECHIQVQFFLERMC